MLRVTLWTWAGERFSAIAASCFARARRIAARFERG